jgi:hypothetical protein
MRTLFGRDQHQVCNIFHLFGAALVATLIPHFLWD